MNTETEYRLQQLNDGNWNSFGGIFKTQQEAEAYARNFRDNCDITYRVVTRIVTHIELPPFTVSADPLTPEEFAQEVAGYADGSYHIEWNGIERYTPEQQQSIKALVYEMIAECDACGWHWSCDDLTDSESGQLCYVCYERIFRRRGRVIKTRG